jgi:hypothetical protein
MDSRKCRTAAVSPAEPGVYPLLIRALHYQSELDDALKDWKPALKQFTILFEERIEIGEA